MKNKHGENNPSGGTPISADRLNYIEDGIKNAADVADSKVAKAGDTMSGNLYVLKSNPEVILQDSSISYSDSAPSSNIYPWTFMNAEKNGKQVGAFQTRINTSNIQNTGVQCSRYGTTASTDGYI